MPNWPRKCQSAPLRASFFEAHGTREIERERELRRLLQAEIPPDVDAQERVVVVVCSTLHVRLTPRRHDRDRHHAQHRERLFCQAIRHARTHARVCARTAAGTVNALTPDISLLDDVRKVRRKLSQLKARKVGSVRSPSSTRSHRRRHLDQVDRVRVVGEKSQCSGLQSSHLSSHLS